MPLAVWRDLGRLAYEPAWEVQRQTVGAVLAGGPDTLLFVEHDPVLTLGASFKEENLLLTREQYAAHGIDVVRTDRGGDVTYHGPRQLVVYPVFDVQRHGRDLHRWMRDLEETMVLTLRHFGLEGERFPPHTGCWCRGGKVAAIGVKLKRWVSLHGIALNCDNDLAPFDMIVPCGIQGHGVTSLSLLSGRGVTTSEAMPVVREAFASVFGLEWVAAPTVTG